MRQGGREGDLVRLNLVFLGVETALKVKSKTAASVEDTPSRRQSSKRAEGAQDIRQASAYASTLVLITLSLAHYYRDYSNTAACQCLCQDILRHALKVAVGRLVKGQYTT